MLRFPVALAVLSVAALLQACAAPTYINIPSQRGDTAFHSPNGPSVVAVETAALASIVSEQEPGPYEFVLPKGTTVEVYSEVANLLGPDAIIPAEDGAGPASDFPMYEARGIRIRGGSAEVDVIRPGTLSDYQLVEVRLEWSPFGGWNVTDKRPRRITVQPPKRPSLDLLPDTAGLSAPPETEPEPTTPEMSDEPATPPAPEVEDEGDLLEIPEGPSATQP